jgi:hypothetical protein
MIKYSKKWFEENLIKENLVNIDIQKDIKTYLSFNLESLSTSLSYCNLNIKFKEFLYKKMNENLKPYPYTIGLYQLEKHTLPCLRLIITITIG